jgi:hypothetical protein
LTAAKGATETDSIPGVESKGLGILVNMTYEAGKSACESKSNEWKFASAPARLMLGLATVLLIFGSVTAGGSASAGEAEPSAGQLFQTSQSAAAREASLHYVAVTTTTGVSVTITGNVSAFSGEQTIVARALGRVGHVKVSLVAGISYFKGDEPGLAVVMGLPQAVATKFAGQWIAVGQTDAAFASLSAGLTTSSVLSEIPLTGPLNLQGTTQKEGRSVLAVKGFDSGTPAGTTKTVKIPVLLYLAKDGRHLPVLYTATRTLDGKRQTESTSLSGWGKPVTVAAPVGALPVSSLGSTPTEV